MGIGNNPMRDLELAIYAQELARLSQTDSFARDHTEAFMWQAEWWRGRFEEREVDDPDRARYKALYTQLGIDFETGETLASTPR